MSEKEIEVKHLYNRDQMASANGYLEVDIDGEFHKLQVTARAGATPTQVAATVRAYVEGVREARKEFPKPVSVSPVNASSETPKPAEPRRPGKFDAVAIPFDQLPPELQMTPAEGGPIEVFRNEFDYIEVKPQPDDKCVVEFWTDNAKYPHKAKINKWRNEKVGPRLAALGDIDVTKAQKVRVRGYLFWKNGDEYTKQDGSKGHWTDFLMVERVL